jgi:hypothetical protein
MASSQAGVAKRRAPACRRPLNEPLCQRKLCGLNRDLPTNVPLVQSSADQVTKFHPFASLTLALLAAPSLKLRSASTQANRSRQSSDKHAIDQSNKRANLSIRGCTRVPRGNRALQSDEMIGITRYRGSSQSAPK